MDIPPRAEVEHVVRGANPALIALEAGYNGRLSARRPSAAAAAAAGLGRPSRLVSPKKHKESSV